MHASKKKWPTSFVALCLFFAATANADTAATKDAVNDAWLKTKLVTAYTLNRHLSPFTISTEIVSGKATLTGTVDSSVEKELAERIALSVEGVTSVDNRLVIEESVARNQNKFFQNVEDATTAASVYTKLLGNRNLNVDALRVISNNGKIKLEGSVGTDSEKDLAEMVAADTTGVRDVDNTLTVRGKELSTTAKAERAISDSWITTKVRSNILFSNGTSGSDVEIETKGGIVTLSGKARTSAQKELLERIAESVSGVKNVNNELRTVKTS